MKLYEEWIDRQIEMGIEAYLEEASAFALIKHLQAFGYTLEEVEEYINTRRGQNERKM